ncbi:MAG TPA: hypothetical protein VKE27_12500, partial [Candidatus Dormibacteraeota bacterium]|nr:hypothetical protein [Candidatus Dormibacteraeota bacterium]
MILSLAIDVAFAVLALRSAFEWALEPDRRHAFLAAGLLALTLDIIISPELYVLGLAGQLATDVSVVLFLGSGLGLLMFRDAFVPFQARTRNIVTGVIALA